VAKTTTKMQTMNIFRGPASKHALEWVYLFCFCCVMKGYSTHKEILLVQNPSTHICVLSILHIINQFLKIHMPWLFFYKKVSRKL